MVRARALSPLVRHRAADADVAVNGMLYGASIRTIEGGIAAIPDMTLARVNPTDCRAATDRRGGRADPIRFVSRTGSQPRPDDDVKSDADETHEMYMLLRCLAVAAFAAMTVLLLPVAIASGSAMEMTPGQRDVFHWLPALIAVPATAYAGRPFFRSFARAMATGRLNVDVPISGAIVLALGLPLIETLNHAAYANFAPALMLLTVLAAGRTLEQAIRRRTPAFAANLVVLQDETVAKFVNETELAEVPVMSVRSGDLVLVRPGERIAVDGVITDGRSEIDQSLVSGETLPVSVARDSMVYAGTLNVSGTLRVKVSSAERDAPPDRGARMPGRALETTGHTNLAGRAVHLYPPLVLAIASATLSVWLACGASFDDAVTAAIAVLVVTYPAALGVAVAAVLAETSRALSRAGMLLRSTADIERLGRIDTILFDKTGTLTWPQPEVINTADIPPERLALAGRLALASRHPLATAVARAADATVPLTAVEEPGQGVRCEFKGVALRLGRPSFCDAERRAAAVLETDPEASVIAFAYGTERYALAVRQRLRSDAIETVAKLRQDGFTVEILSGDRAPAVAHAADTLGIERWQAGVTAADKAAYISALQARGRSVLMVGDGVNDATSLAAADASLSVATAAHPALAAADAVFAGDRLMPVASVIAIARQARRLMGQNLLFTAGCNVAATPAAILGFVSPPVAALAMLGASVLVTLNALRARARERL